MEFEECVKIADFYELLLIAGIYWFRPFMMNGLGDIALNSYSSKFDLYSNYMEIKITGTSITHY